MRKPLTAAALLAALGGGFVWGFFAHRNHIPPYWSFKTAARSLGWTRIPPEAEPRRHELWPEASAAAEAVRSLPYVAGTRDPRPERRGVIRHLPERAFPGVNVYSPIPQGRAYLIDMEGRVLHEWAHGSDAWQHVEPLGDGSLLAIVKDERLLALDRRSELRWEARARFHHSLSRDESGRIYALTRREDRVPAIHPEIDCVVDFLTVLSPDGEILEQVSLLDLVLRSRLAELLPSVHHRSLDRELGALDPLHTNHVEVFDGRLADRSPLYARGNLLVSFRGLSTVAILDGTSREVLWAWGPNNIAHQHHPSLLDDGHVLIFDNGPPERERSRVIEVDPLTRRVVWHYTADDLFSRTRGSAQRLPNGNTLIAESDTGYAFEVTPDGERVWTFADPHFTADGRRAAIWWMTRHSRDELGFGAPGAGPSGPD